MNTRRQFLSILGGAALAPTLPLPKPATTMRLCITQHYPMRAVLFTDQLTEIMNAMMERGEWRGLVPGFDPGQGKDVSIICMARLTEPGCFELMEVGEIA